MLNVLVFGMDPQQAVEAPRFATQSVTNSFYPRSYYPGRLHLRSASSRQWRSSWPRWGMRSVRVGVWLGL